MAVVTCPSVISTGEDAKVLTGAETYGHTVHCLQPVLETDGEGRTQMLHHPGAAVQMVVASHQGAWGSARDTVDYILHLNGSFKREWLGFPWQQAGSITRRWLSFLPQPTSGSGICPLPSLPFWILGTQPVPRPRPKQIAMWVVSVHTPGYAQSSLSSAQPQPSEGGRDRRKQHTPGTRAKQSRRDRARWRGGPRGLHVTPGFPDLYLANQGDGESSEVEMVNRARKGETYWLTVTRQVTQNMLFRAEKGYLTDVRVKLAKTPTYFFKLSRKHYMYIVYIYFLLYMLYEDIIYLYIIYYFIYYYV